MELEHDPVRSPAHYIFPGGVEVIHLTQHLNFLRGNAVKYVARAGRKGDRAKELEDLNKAAECIRQEIERLNATVASDD